MAENPENDPRIALAGERTNFAKFRTSLALDRTTLAWIRTALTFATFGFGMVGFFRATVQATQTEQALHLHQAAIHGGCADSYRAGLDDTGGILPLDDTAQVATR